ncbi:hypothetical protein ACIPVB_12990 [Microbacterium sp. NPDC090007]|uniref:hypothetical protein n=1 Tax=Microbacterium sp. NPDC090007 TaxID=3364204 RepID=UPI00381FD860
MIEHLEVTPYRLSTAAAGIKAAGGEIEALVGTLVRESATLSLQWSGDAQQALRGRRRSWASAWCVEPRSFHA